MKICLAAESFPPLIDGVVNVVMNYADKITAKYGEAVVATPSNPEAEDNYPYEVLRYASINTTKAFGYRTGYPFSASAMRRLAEFSPDIIHSHCPMASTFLARELRDITGAPIIMTYHTKFDIDIKRCIKLKLLNEFAIKQMVNNIETCDEVWAVNRGAGENLKSLGFSGDYVVMKNGVDFANIPAPDDDVAALNDEYKIPSDGTPVFLFVGRILWYKGIHIILDALRELKNQGKEFKMFFVGKGEDEKEIREYNTELGLDGDCVFTGPVYDRKKLKAFYTRADLFFLPSVFDNDPLVVKEAAASHTASVLIKDSSAADDVIDMTDGVLIEENPESMVKALFRFYENPGLFKILGENASRDLYLSWDDSVARAVARYEEVMKRIPKGKRDKKIEFIGDTYRAVEKIRSIGKTKNGDSDENNE